MEYIRIPGIEKDFARLVMGTAWFIDESLENEIFSMLDAYVELGGNVIDTGRFYGNGKAEGLLKKWLDSRRNRDDLVIIDKCCHHLISRDTGRHYPEYCRVKPDLITDDLRYSLIHTGCDYFDLYLLHRDDENVPVADICDRLEQHRQEGLIRAYGVSNWKLPRVQAAMEYCAKQGYQGLALNNPSYSLVEVMKPRWAGVVYIDDAEAQWHADNQLPILSWAAQANGFFADIYPRDGSAPADVQAAFFNERNFEKLRRCQELGKLKNASSINIALAYVLNRPYPLAAVIGSRNKQELVSCVEAMNIKLTAAEQDYLALRRDSLE